MISIRTATEADYIFFPEIELSAAQAFRKYDLDIIADMEPATIEDYKNLPKKSVIHVAEHLTKNLVGFAVTTEIDNQAYLKEISVQEDMSGQGIGRELLQAVIQQAKQSGYKFLTLTSFTDIPFNVPFYKKNHFSIFEPDHNWPELLDIRIKEKDLEINPRVAMRLNLVK